VTDRVLTWGDGARFEYVHAYLRLGALSARGTLLTGGETPHRIDYQLDTDAHFVLKRLTIHASGAHADPERATWSRTLRVARDFEGNWTLRRTADDPDDQLDLIDSAALADATDCDIATSSLTLCTPVMRHRLHRRPGRHVVVVAWVSLPDLSVHRRERIVSRLSADGPVLFDDLGGALNFDADGFVTPGGVDLSPPSELGADRRSQREAEKAGLGA
jgi:hypothetical protein